MTAYVPAVVLGAGPTGTTAANLLGQYGVRCLVIDRWPDVYPLPRAVHFDDEVFRIFAGMGLADQVAAISRPLPGMRLTDRDHRVLAEITRDAARQEHGFPQANMFDQPELERVLRDALARFPHVELRSGTEVVDVRPVDGGPGRVLVRYRAAADRLSGSPAGQVREIWTDLFLGCDGANSMTRAVVGTRMDKLCFEQKWLVVDVDSPDSLPTYDGAQQVCHHERAATFMPVVPGRYRWEFRLDDDDQRTVVDDDEVRSLIAPWSAGVDAAKLTVVRKACYTFRGLVADRWQNGRVFLLGDAAHQTPPFIGQGMCAGVRDAANLAWKAALVLTGQADEAILTTYAEERRPYAHRVVQLAVTVGWLMTGGTRRTAPLRGAVLRSVAAVPGIEDRLMGMTWPAFGPGPLVERRGRRSLAGSVLPQPRVRIADGTVVRLDRVLGAGFAIVARGPDPLAAYDPALTEWFTALGVVVLRVGVDIEDVDGVLTRLLDRAGANAVLLRPDRVIAAAADRADLRHWQQLLRAAGVEPVDREHTIHVGKTKVNAS